VIRVIDDDFTTCLRRAQGRHSPNDPACFAHADRDRLHAAKCAISYREGAAASSIRSRQRPGTSSAITIEKGDSTAAARCDDL